LEISYPMKRTKWPGCTHVQIEISRLRNSVPIHIFSVQLSVNLWMADTSKIHSDDVVSWAWGRIDTWLIMILSHH
jgi:hypothetical protein